LQIAKNFEPKKIVGMDIDVKLIYAARKNIRFYMDKIENEKNKYPISCEIVHGSLMTQLFPKNVYFIQVNFMILVD
jgi:7SK snRNA methylphosphate capping enzyme